MGKIASTISYTLTLTIKVYQNTLSLMLAKRCRFYPSCSNFALGAINRHGSLRGSYIALKRILRCHPWHPGGIDPVPE